MEINPATSAPASKPRTSKVRAAAEAEPAKSKTKKQTKATAANAIESKPEKAAKPRKSSSKTQSVGLTEPVSVVRPSTEELSGMIAQAAYYIAAQRNFSPGNELDDWLNAEREILSRYAQ